MKLSTIKRRFNKEFKWVTYPNPLIKAAPRIWTFILEYFEPKNNQVEAQVILQDEPLPCPFCKTLPEKYQVGDRPSRGEKGTTYVRCLNNNCAIWREPIMLTKWNKRAGREPQSK